MCHWESYLNGKSGDLAWWWVNEYSTLVEYYYSKDTEAMYVVKTSANDGTKLAIFVNSGQCMSHHVGGSPSVKYTISYQTKTCVEERMTLKYIFKYWASKLDTNVPTSIVS